MAHLFSVCGTPAAFLHPMDALHVTMGVLAGSDILITISKGGESAELNDLIQLARRRDLRADLGVVALDPQIALRHAGPLLAVGQLVGAVGLDAVAQRRQLGIDVVVGRRAAAAALRRRDGQACRRRP